MTPPYATIRQVELETNYYFVMAYLASFATDLPPQIEVEDSLLQKNTVGVQTLGLNLWGFGFDNS